MDKYGTWKNRIICVAVLVFVFIMAAQAMHNGMFTALALEQPARCGMEEHIHTEACYIDHVLICEKKAHTHSESCYLLLLEDNDINWLLSAVDNTPDNNLNSVIESAVFQALTSDSTDEEIATNFAETLQTSLTLGTVAAQTTAYTAAYTTAHTTTGFFFTDVVETTAYETTAPVATLYALENTTIDTLNATITENNIEPAVVLNENLISTMALANTANNSGISVAAVGGTASTSTLAINFYIRLDGNITFINSGTLTYNDSKNTQKKREYYSYTDTVKAYTDVVVTGLTTNTINSTYYFRYNTSGSTSDFDKSAQYQSPNVYFADSNKAQYAILSTSENSTAPVDFYTVTLNYSAVDGGTDAVQYVESGLDSTLSLDAAYDWVDADGNAADASDLETITKTTTLYAKPKGYTVAFDSNGGTAVASQIVAKNGQATAPTEPTRTGYTFAGWYSDSALTTEYDFNSTVTSNITLYAKWEAKEYTFTFKDADGNVTETRTVKYGTSETLPDPGDGFVWVSGSNAYSGGSTVTVTGDQEFTAGASAYATYIYADGTTQTSAPVIPGTSITLPSVSQNDNVWVDQDGNSYAGGATVMLYKNMTFTERITLTVSYTVNFPTSDYSFHYTVYAPSASPTVYGTDSDTASFLVTEGGETTIRTVSQTIVRLETAHGKDFTYPVYFKGWESETGDEIDARSRLSWQELESYDADGDGTVTMTGVWEHGVSNAVNFFILHHANVDETTGNADDYTPSIYSTYMGNSDTTKTPLYTANDDATALANDAKIRAMHGQSGDGMWLYSFPSDGEIFEALKDHVSDLSVNGEKVLVENLNSNEYAIRWYQVIYDSGDGWHIDGKLVRKVGVIHVVKEFAGNETLIDSAKEGFYITATNADSSKYYVLTIDALTAAEQTAHEAYRSGAVFITPIDDGDGNPNTYLWEIEGVRYNEEWNIQEHIPPMTDIADYSEWAIIDSSVNSQTANGGGTQVSVHGVTQATDVNNPEWLRVEFNNIYYRGNSLMIKKEDGATGEALSGAEFMLYQNGKPMAFVYDADTGLYDYDYLGTDENAVTRLTGEGYINIATTGFTYTYDDETDTGGDITVLEITAPDQYNPVGAIVVGYLDDGETVGIKNSADSGEYASYQNGMLIVKNNTNTLSVTVQKEWQCEEDEQADIVVQLLAQGSANLAAALTGEASSIVTLTEANDYSYTWTDLPVYAYGAEVEWSIRETKIGTEDCKADYTFANWAVSYDIAKHDADGNVTLVVHNTPKRPMLYLTKITEDASLQLPGATFTLVQVDASGNAVANFVPRTATTGANGVLIFDNLLYGVRYKITEDTPPPGYIGFSEPIYLTIAEGGIVTVETHDHARADAVAFNIFVTNEASLPLPETGGGGTFLYTCGGLLLMAASLLLYKALRRREEFPDV